MNFKTRVLRVNLDLKLLPATERKMLRGQLKFSYDTFANKLKAFFNDSMLCATISLRSFTRYCLSLLFRGSAGVCIDSHSRSHGRIRA